MIRNFSVVLVLGSLVLSGCDTVSLLRDSKIANSFHVGSDKGSVEKDFGQPTSTIPTLNGNGICYNYIHTLPNGNTTPLYVGFRNSDNKVVTFGTITCEKALEKGYLETQEPIKQIY